MSLIFVGPAAAEKVGWYGGVVHLEQKRRMGTVFTTFLFKIILENTAKG